MGSSLAEHCTVTKILIVEYPFYAAHNFNPLPEKISGRLVAWKILELTTECSPFSCTWLAHTDIAQLK